MPQAPDSQYQRCFISAPFGLELGALPELLTARGIAWEWANDDSALKPRDASSGIAAADFALIILNGTRADYRSSFDAGIAVGLKKPVLLIQARSRSLPLDYRQFTTVKASLSNRDALAFHLDLFLASPLPIQSLERAALEGRDSSLGPTKRRDPVAFGTDLERRAYDAVVAAGGSAIAEPRSGPDAKYRPDLLAWLGHLDSELLDPTVIEVRSHADLKSMRQLENRLLSFMQAARIRSALILTAMPTPVREQQPSPNIFWLTIDEFETLARTEGLGDFVRRTRNRIVHGAR